MEAVDIKRTLFSVSDFLDWQRGGTLDLAPPFQRRSVWRPGAKSFLIDTIVRGLPIPLIFIRERLDLDTMRPKREVIDGQQRLRTLFSYIDPSVLSDWNEEADTFTVRAEHNAEIGGKGFGRLPKSVRSRILGYEFSTHVLPTETEDRDILTIFARLNSTGTTLNRQELRNAKFFGAFKTLMYSLAYEQLERWLDWNVLSEDQVARMLEVELTSDLTMNMVDGVTGKSQPKIDAFYERFDDRVPQSKQLADRFREVMDSIDEVLGSRIQETVFSREVNFFTLFTYIYDRKYGLGSALDRRRPKALPSRLRSRLLRASRDIRAQEVPDEVLDAIRRASADIGRRRTRLRYLKTVCDGSSRSQGR